MSEAAQTLDGWYCFMIFVQLIGQAGKCYQAKNDKRLFMNFKDC